LIDFGVFARVPLFEKFGGKRFFSSSDLRRKKYFHGSAMVGSDDADGAQVTGAGHETT
jgi:hypothetical protein